MHGGNSKKKKSRQGNNKKREKKEKGIKIIMMSLLGYVNQPNWVHGSSIRLRISLT
jgi:hypothetical protein